MDAMLERWVMECVDSIELDMGESHLYGSLRLKMWAMLSCMLPPWFIR